MADESRIIGLQQELIGLRISDWYEKVFSFQWFFIIFLLIVPWIIWWKLVNKKHIAEIFSFGLLIMVTASILNEIGLQLQLWRGPYTLLPVPARWFAPAYSYLPVTFMLMYQYFRTWKSFTMTTVVAGAISAFVFQPILTWLGMFVLVKWSYFYSFLAFIIAGLVIRLLHYVILKREAMEVGKMEVSNIEVGKMEVSNMEVSNIDANTRFMKQTNFTSPAFKKIINKRKK